MRRLFHGEAHIWMAESSNAADPPLLDLLSAEERVRHSRFAFETGRNQYLISHALVRNTLSRYGDVDPKEWRFAANEYGCPHIIAPQEMTWLRFNLSHTKGLSAVIVARETDVGVDVENMERTTDLHNLAQRFFAASEAAQVQTPLDFFTFWTLKESYIKARGMGLALPLDGFAFDLQSNPPDITFNGKIDDDPAQWRFLTAQPTPVHRLAAAMRSRQAVTFKLQ